MKRILIFILVVTAIFVITACSDGNEAGVQETPGASPSQNGESPSGSGADPGTPGNSDNSGDDNGNGADSYVNDDPQTPPAFSFLFRDVVIELDDDIDYIISKLGEPQGDFRVPSCAFEGFEDRIIGYPGIQFTAYPSGEQHKIFNISFFDDLVRTSEGGVRIGAPVQAIIDTYGDDYSYETGMYKFTRGLTSLVFITEDGFISGISYRLDLGL
jgi:hypothetical protein